MTDYKKLYAEMLFHHNKLQTKCAELEAELEKEKQRNTSAIYVPLQWTPTQGVHVPHNSWMYNNNIAIGTVTPNNINTNIISVGTAITSNNNTVIGNGTY